MSENTFGDNWGQDKLKRIDEAAFLTDYLIGKSRLEPSNFHNGSFVLNINAEWGFGKTYFLCNWADDLSSKGHPVVYFDAWKNDFSKEPLVAFISTINSQLEPYFNKKIGEKRATKIKALLGDWYGKGKKIISPSSPLLWSILAKKLAGMSMDQLADLFDEDDLEISDEAKEDNEAKKEVENTVSTIVSKAATNLLASHNSTKKTIADFKTSLEKLTRHLSTLKTVDVPIFIFVDELDRCRPNYAIELLESIKHLFGVYGVFFVVATASEQLCHSIKKVYGQDFDSYNYLKRFFDQTYTLKEPDRAEFSVFLFSEYGLDTRENLFSPLNSTLFQNKNINVEIFAFMSAALNLGLRDMVQYCVIIDSVSLTFKKAPLHLVFVIFLIWLKGKRKDLYDRFAERTTFSNKEISDLIPNMKREIATHQYDSPHSKSPSTISASALIQEYFRLSRIALKNIVRNHNSSQPQGKEVLFTIESALQEEMPHQYPNNAIPDHYLGEYPKLIDQAGRLS